MKAIAIAEALESIGINVKTVAIDELSGKIIVLTGRPTLADLEKQRGKQREDTIKKYRWNGAELVIK